MRYAIKKLTRSDLTFFEYQFRRQQAGNQKSINLNRNVFVDLIFPAAGLAAGGVARQFPVPVSIYGPGLHAQPHMLTRKIIAAGGSQKNWRLNGEFVPDPDFDRARYHRLAEDDMAVFGFDGANGLPIAVFMVLLSQSEGVDSALLREAETFLAGRSMAALSAAQVERMVQSSPANHPLRELLETERDEAMLEASLGSAAGVAKLLRQPSSRRMTAEALATARQSAEAAGRNGEILVDVWLRKRVRDGTLVSSDWIAEVNAVNPWDFNVAEPGGNSVRVEVKATTGAFERALHISQAEILSAATAGKERTDIYRVFALSADGGYLRICRDVRNFAEGVALAASGFPRGVVPDSYSVSPASIGTWEDAIEIRFDEDDE